MSRSFYFLQGATIGLTWLVAVNAAMAAGVVAAARRPRPDRQARGSAASWLALRLLPSGASVAFVALLYVPSYWRYEPRDLVEGIDVTLAALAGAALLVIGAAATRGVLAWARAARRTRAWLAAARPVALAGAAIPAFEIDAAAPVMALVGVFRPRLLVTRGAIGALTPDELRASIAHEIGHWRAKDNLKRLLMRAAPDLLFATRTARALEARWAQAAEHEADRRACADVDSRCALASALVKIARLTPPHTPLGEPISTLVDGGDIAARVRALLDDAPDGPHAPRPMSAWTAAGAAAVMLAVAYGPLLRVVHAATELVVNALP